MSTTYLNDEKEIVFLNNKNIAQETHDIDSIPYNAIPSLSIFNRLSDDVALSASNVSVELNSLQNTDLWLSSQVSSRVVVAYKDELTKAYHLANSLSVIEVTNDEYNTLVNANAIEKKALYIIKDTFIDAKNQVISNLAGPTVDSHAANKSYVDTVSASVFEMAEEYANSLSTSLSTTIPNEIANEIEALSTSLSGTVDAKRKKDVSDLSTSLSTTIKNANYAVYSTLDLKYDKNLHFLSVEIQNVDGTKKIAAIDANDFVKNKIVDHMKVIGDSLYIYWSTGDDVTTAVNIPLTALAEVYDAGDGITITKADAFTIAADYTKLASKSEFNLLSGKVDTLSTSTIPAIGNNVDVLSNTTIPAIITNVSTLSTEITATTDSSKLAGKVAKNRENIETLSTNINTKFLLSGDAVDAIRNTLLAQINANNSQIIANSDSINDIKTYVNSISGTPNGVLPVLRTDLNTLSGNVNSDIGGINTTLESYGTRLDAIDNASSGKIHTLEGSVNTLDGKIGILSGEHQSFENRLNADEITFNLLNDNIIHLSGNVQEWDSNIIASINTLSGKLSTDVDSLSGRLSTEIDTLSTNLSTAITNKIFVNGTSVESLSVQSYISQDAFHDLVIGDDIQPNTIYMISSDTLDMYDQKIVNLADAEDKYDAVNMNTLSTMANDLSSNLKLKILESLVGLESVSTVDGIKSILMSLSAAMLT